jgi:hypothetical protein
MNEVRWVLTDRLDLRETNPADDLEELFAIFNDPSGWWYNPAGRHTDREASYRSRRYTRLADPRC